MLELKERKDLDEQYFWDLQTLFASEEEWEKALNKCDEYVGEFAAYSGKLKDADTILSCLKAQVKAFGHLENVYCYASLRNTEDMRNNKAQSMYSRAMGKYTSLMAATAFITPEILSLDDATLNKLVNDEKLADYRHLLEDLLRQKAHTLSTKEETLLSKLQQALGASGEAAEKLENADLAFAPVEDGEGKTHEVSGATFVPLQMSKDRTLRKNAFTSYYAQFKQHIHTFAATYAGCVKGDVAEAEIRGYASSREMHMSGNNIPLSVYDNLIATVEKNMDKMHRYAALRKRILGVDELHYYDVYAPLSEKKEKEYSWEEAKELVVEAVKPLGEAYVQRVKDAYRDRWIDVYPNKGKRGGAFSSGTYTSNPYILLNFTNGLDDVSTLAHEMGHSQHSWLANHTQPQHYADYTLFVAEVASTVNENLLIEQLLEKTSDLEERLALLNQYLEGFKGTVYRQTMFAEFEKEAHAMQERGESLDSDSLCSLYESLVRKYFGDTLVIDDEVKYEWARIPHFYRPFYVYVYATGYTSAVALSEGILKDGEPAVKKYLEFLSMGSSQYPLDELKHGGVDLSTSEPIQRALDKFGRVLDEVEDILKKLGK